MKRHLKTKTRRVAKRFPRRLLTGVLLAIAVLTTGVVVGLSRQKAGANNTGSVAGRSTVTKDNKTYITRYVGGQKIEIDPQTGQVKPLTPEEAQRVAEGLKELANQSTEGLQQVQHADGSVSIDLQDRFQNVALAKKEADGGVSQACIDNPQAGAAFFGIDPKLVGSAKTNTASSTSKSPANK